MDRVGDQLAELAPALAFLLAAVPLATLLDRLGFFRAVAARLAGPRGTSVLALWLVAAATTIVLNLDTTIVLLTPLYVRIRGTPTPIRSSSRSCPSCSRAWRRRCSRCRTSRTSSSPSAST